MKNEWLQNEVNSIKQELKSRKNRGDRMFPYLMTMAIILLIATSTMYAEPILNREGTEIAGYFPSTWTCHNRHCGYENYDGIDYCALCGTRRR